MPISFVRVSDRGYYLGPLNTYSTSITYIFDENVLKPFIRKKIIIIIILIFSMPTGPWCISSDDIGACGQRRQETEGPQAASPV